jgi:asparagine synthase (glutamine-hydrolysing)
MCGIFGYIGTKSFSMEKAISVISHRGPDASGYLTYDCEFSILKKEKEASMRVGKKVAFGFRRLAIIDLQSHSNQPFSEETQQYHIIFNGEIYNYPELRELLKREGYVFQTTSDTEVLLKSYMHWGINCFQYFNGMWAACILDLKKRKLVVSRDRFGIKPLYYHIDNQGISFFSEIKQIFETSISKKINESVVRDFLESAVLDAGEETFFKGVYKFPQAHYGELNLDENNWEIKPIKFWDLKKETKSGIAYPDAVVQFRELFEKSIELRFRSDVPVGACLSGGLDSSSIVSFAGYLGKKINTFTIDNKDKELSEIEYVNDVINKYPALTSVVGYNEENDLDLLDTIFNIQDEPISGLGVIAQWRVMQLAAKNNVVVLLDGQGGDELFGGYRKFVFFYLKELIQQGNILKALSEARHFLGASDFKIFEKEGVRRYLNRTGVSEFLSQDLLQTEKQHNIGLSGASGFMEKSYEDIFYYSYPQLLRYEDRNSMAFSLESRVPFLDYRLVEFVYGLPSSYKIREGYTKTILRDSMKGILPDSVRLRKSKMGFATPEKRWITETYRTYFHSYFETLDNPYLKRDLLIQEIKKNRGHLDYKTILRLYLFDRWYQLNFGKIKKNSTGQ